MQAITEKNGNVTFVLDGDDAEMLSRFHDQARNNLDHEVLASMLDHFGFAGNAQFMPIMPADVGALTDAPMFTDGLDITDAGHSNVTGAVWWYPGYELKSFSQILQDEGKVTFTKAIH